MQPDLSAEERARVIQADRDAAADYMAHVSAMMGAYNPVAMAFMDEACDSLPIVQALARHRLAFEAATIERCATKAEGMYRGHGKAMHTQRAYAYEHAGKRIAAAIRQLHSGEGAGRGPQR